MQGSNFYPTPAWAVHALANVEKFDGGIWECACGDGQISKVLTDYGYKVRSSDLYDYGYGETGHDFLLSQETSDNIVTNPPFNIAESFVWSALAKSKNKVCFLLRLAFLEGAARYTRLFAINPPSRIHVFTERITMYPPGIEVKGTSTTAFAWFVWDKTATNRQPIISWIEPGTRKRYQNDSH